MRFYWIFSAPASQLFAGDMLTSALNKEPQPTRVLAIFMNNPRDPFLSGDALMSHGIRQVMGYHGNRLARYDQLLLGGRPDYSQLVNPNLWRLLNVKYLLADVPELGFIANIQRVAGPVKNAAGTDEYLFVFPARVRTRGSRR